MSHRREMLFAILFYVALDLSLPAMPGAFSLESAGSLESTGTARARLAPAVSAPARDSFPVSRRRIDVEGRVVPVRDVPRVPRHPLVSRTLRATVDPPAASEEPH